MKKQILLVALVLGSCFSANAQVSVHFNIGLQPVWGPVGYDYVDYYYIPDIDAYYDVTHQQYVYDEGGRWVTRGYLPPRYRDFDLYGAYKVVVNEPRPWMHHDRYRTQYAAYRGRHDQAVIRDSRDERYYANPHHPHHNEWHGNNGHGGDHGHIEQHGNPHGGDHGHGQPHQNGGDHGHGQPQQHGNDHGGDHGHGQPQQHGHEEHGGDHGHH